MTKFGIRYHPDVNWKLRVGDYRVVYKISDKMVTVLCICHRKNVYKKASIR
jgi:mRNA interferase RelE/StbE